MTSEERKTKKRLVARLRGAYKRGELTDEQINRAEELGIELKMVIDSGAKDLASKYPDLAAEWHPTKNGDLEPTDVTAGSNKKVWWLGECGHEWEQGISSRVRLLGQGCPYCAGRKLLLGFNDLAATNPEIAAEWHPTKNGDLSPEDVTAGSGRKVWWLGRCGHEWESTVSNRAFGCGCPYCCNRKVLIGFNDLATTHPSLAGEWHPTKNGELRPTDVVAGGAKKIWWQCSKGHEWQATLNNRSCHLKGCPYCAGKKVLPGFNDLASKYPEIAAEWHPTKNGGLKPRDITEGSNKKVWWMCSCGHEWRAVVSSRTGGVGCPYCAGKKVLPGFNDLASKYPDLAAEWHPAKNGDLEPTDVTAGSKKKVWWLGKCGHEWESGIAGRSLRGYGCPVCASLARGKTIGKAVVCVETGEGFDSITVAANAFSGMNRKKISNACKDPTRTAYGYHWRYAEEDDSND